MVPRLPAIGRLNAANVLPNFAGFCGVAFTQVAFANVPFLAFRRAA
jgi:hypothetical protein